MKKILVLVLLVLVMGCTKKHVTQPAPAVDDRSGLAGRSIKGDVEAVHETIQPRESELADKMTEEVYREGKAFLDTKDVYFNFDKYDIGPNARITLDSVAAWLKKNNGVNLIIEGHCDEKGTNEYNLALGEKRANAVKSYLAAMGIVSSRMKIISYGEEKQICTEQNEACWQKNRRAHFTIAR